MLEVFNFICQLAPAAHEFQISIFGFRVLGFLRRNGTFDSFDPEPFWPCRHRRQRAKIFDVPVVHMPVYAQGAVGQWAARRAAEGRPIPNAGVTVRSRLWFNEANDSRYFLVPGLIVLIMTLIGAFLTALVMAREWERGTAVVLRRTNISFFEL
jgi:hypothetical protein